MEPSTLPLQVDSARVSWLQTGRHASYPEERILAPTGMTFALLKSMQKKPSIAMTQVQSLVLVLVVATVCIGGLSTMGSSVSRSIADRSIADRSIAGRSDATQSVASQVGSRARVERAIARRVQEVAKTDPQVMVVGTTDRGWELDPSLLSTTTFGEMADLTK